VSARLRVVIADDERPARSLLRALLERYDDVEVVGEAEDGAKAVELIERTAPDLALLDLRMPRVDGFGVVRLLPDEKLPLVAFVTAHDEHALEAFEVNAIDYLLKPVDGARLRETLNRAIERRERESLAERAESVREAVGAVESRGHEPLLRIPVRRRDEVVLVPAAAVTRIEADGELLHIHTRDGEKFVINHRLKDLERRLPDGEFVRVSRGALVRVDEIETFSTLPGGNLLLRLRDGTELQASRIQSKILRDQLLRL
jgi:two-component system, LytTR family, response regulator